MINVNFYKKTINLVLLVLIHSACVSTQVPMTNDLNEQIEINALDRPLKENTKDEEASVLSEAQKLRISLSRFVSKFTLPGASLTVDDRELITRLVESNEGSFLEEASLVLGLVAMSLSKPDEFNQAKLDEPNLVSSDLKNESDLDEDRSLLSQAVKEEELEPREEPNARGGELEWSSETNLEALLTIAKLDLAQALQTNPYLKSYDIQRLVWKSLQHGNNKLSEGFLNSVRAALKLAAKQWVQFGKDLDAGEESLKRERSSILSADEFEEGVAPALEFLEGDFTDDELKLKEAQALIVQQKYIESIDLLKSIDDKGFFHAAAEEKIVEASNKAVQSYRKKAAKAFQSAIPVADTKARAAYLRDAQKYLSLAIENFPKADQIDTVRQNLEVINRNLETLMQASANN